MIYYLTFILLYIGLTVGIPQDNGYNYNNGLLKTSQIGLDLTNLGIPLEQQNNNLNNNNNNINIKNFAHSLNLQKIGNSINVINEIKPEDILFLQNSFVSQLSQHNPQNSGHVKQQDNLPQNFNKQNKYITLSVQQSEQPGQLSQPLTQISSSNIITQPQQQQQQQQHVQQQQQQHVQQQQQQHVQQQQPQIQNPVQQTVISSPSLNYIPPQQQTYSVHQQPSQQIQQQQQYQSNYNVNEYQKNLQQNGLEPKNIYVHLPDHPIHQRPQYRIPPRKHYKIILVKSPTKPTPPPIQIPQVEEKTLVYVLIKKPDQPTNEELQSVLEQHTVKSSKPEVYFIKYKTKNNGESKLQPSSETEASLNNIPQQLNTLNNQTPNLVLNSIQGVINNPESLYSAPYRN